MEAMAELPERTRIALMMHRFDGFKLRDIAAHLGISVALAHALVYEGLEHCRRRLARGG
jgi:RNA polymerase sigma-70 factor (ECF subfamily)